MLHSVTYMNGDTKFPEIHSNSLPPNWREITEKEFAQSEFFVYTPKTIEYKQAPLGQNHPMESIYLYYFTDLREGIALIGDYWAGKVRYFKFGDCIHEYKETSSQGFLKTYTCSKCGHKYTVDSSG